MPLLPILVALIVVGILLWLVNSFIPMASSIKSILNAGCHSRGAMAAECLWAPPFPLHHSPWQAVMEKDDVPEEPRNPERGNVCAMTEYNVPGAEALVSQRRAEREPM